jgi:hypothetical protein
MRKQKIVLIFFLLVKKMDKIVLVVLSTMIKMVVSH